MTALHSFHQPFIRFKLNDRVRRGALRCPCGFSGLTLASVEGRVGEWISVPGGGRVLIDHVTVPLETTDWIARFQLHPPTLDVLELHVVSRRASGTEEARSLRAGMERRVGGAVRVVIQPVAELTPEPSGKLKKLRSAVNPSG